MKKQEKHGQEWFTNGANGDAREPITIELIELASFKRSESDQIKSFLVTRSESFRPRSS